MSDWTNGYVSELGYTYGYYPELNPERIRLAFLNAGLVMPEIGTACELGFGQGLSINAHAAASTAQWYGNDFNPSHASFAQEVAKSAKTGAAISDESFAEFCVRTDLPNFDYIGLHGIWSWISNENRKIIVDFIRRKLKVGGVLYISYNTQPGWAAMVPMQHLLSEHARLMGAQGTSLISRIDGALAFVDRFLELKPAYATANPGVVERLKRIKEQGRNYLAHEYFNQDWEPMPFSRMAEWLAPAKMSFACSAHYFDHIDAINLTSEQNAFLRGITDTTFRESVRDYLVNTQFRRDYWVKGARALDPESQSQKWREQRVSLTVPRSSVVMKIQGSAGTADLSKAVYEPLLDLLGDYLPHSVLEIEDFLAAKKIVPTQSRQAVLVLAGRGDIVVNQAESRHVASSEKCNAFNAYVLNRAKGSGDIAYLVSPATGGAIGVSRIHQLFVLARASGLNHPSDWAVFAWDKLSRQGHRVIKDGVALTTPEENLAELKAQATQFEAEHLPVFLALAVCSPISTQSPS